MGEFIVPNSTLYRRESKLYADVEASLGRYRSEQLDAIKGIETVKAAAAEPAFREGLVRRFLGMAQQQFKTDVAVLSYQSGIEAAVVNCRFIKPMDEAMLTRLANEADLLVTLEDGSLPGGFGAGVEEFLEDTVSGDRAKVLRLGIPDRFVPHGSIPELLDEIGLTATHVEKAIAERIQKEQRAAS